MASTSTSIEKIMSRVPRNSVKDRIVLAFMELLPLHERSEVSVSAICKRSRCHRTSFYRYFESVDDLDSQFLHLYFYLFVPSPIQTPRSTADLAQHYLSIVAAMDECRSFFESIMGESRLTGYYLRWRALIETLFREYFQPRGLIEDQGLWELNVQFALGIAQRYFELAFRWDGAMERSTLTRWMLEYQWGGYVRMVELQDVDLPASLGALDHALQRRVVVLANKTHQFRYLS